MPMPRTAQRLLVPTVVALALPALAATASAGTLELDFQAYGGGLPIAQGGLTLSTSPGQPGGGRPYEAHLDAGWSSWLSLFTTFHYEASATGTLNGPRPHPARFHSDRRLRGKHDVLDITHDGKAVTVHTEPPMEPEKAARVPEEARRGTVDPLGVGAAVIAAAGTAAACTGTYPVYDGRRRYDVILKPLGPDVLAPSSRRIGSGPAQRCQVTLHPVTGYQTDLDPKKFFAQGIDRTATVWFMAVRGVMVPMQVEVDTNLGTFYVHLIGVREGTRP